MNDFSRVVLGAGAWGSIYSDLFSDRVLGAHNLRTPKWLEITKASKHGKHGELVKLLKSEHGMTHGFANLVAHKTLASDAGSAGDTDLVAAQYADKKAALRPVYDALVAAIGKFGKDVELAPKKADVDAELKGWLKQAYDGA